MRTTGWAVLVLTCLAAQAQGGVSAPNQQAMGERQAHRWSGRTAGKPAYLWPAFKCNYGATIEDCQRQVQDYLDAWYADLNIVFTLSRPASGDYYVVMITSDGSWCPQTSSGTSTEAGVAPFNCNDNPGLGALAFECGHSARACATTIAHEHGHMVGLEHTVSTTDIMNQTILATAAGFDGNSSRVLDDIFNICNLQNQNSYQQMLTALGSWPGGAKPSPFSTTPDAGARDVAPDVAPQVPPDAAPDAAPTGGAVGNPTGGSVDGGAVVALAGFDALTRPPLPTADDSGTTVTAPHRGCGLAGQPSSAPGAGVIVVLFVALAAAFTRSRGRFPSGHRARPAGEPLPCVAPARWPSAPQARDR